MLKYACSCAEGNAFVKVLHVDLFVSFCVILMMLTLTVEGFANKNPGVRNYSIQYIQDNDVDQHSLSVLRNIREEYDPDFVQKLELALVKIKSEIKPDEYGFGIKLTYKPLKNLSNNLFIMCPIGDATRGNYDCFDAAVTVHRILNEAGIKSSVCRGVDELGIFQEHYYAETENGIVIDATPLFPILGARHQLEKILSQHEIEEHIKKGYLNLGGLTPVSFWQNGDSKYFSSLGVVGKQIPLEEMAQQVIKTKEYPAIDFQYRLSEIVQDTVKRIYVMNIGVNRDSWWSFFRKIIYDMREEISSFRHMTLNDMAEFGGIKLKEHGIIRKAKSSYVDEESVPVSKVEDLKIMAQNNMAIASEFVRNAVYCMYILAVQ